MKSSILCMGFGAMALSTAVLADTVEPNQRV